MVASLKKVPHLNDGLTRMYKEEERKRRKKGLSYIDEGELPEFVTKKFGTFIYSYFCFSIDSSRLQCAFARFFVPNMSKMLIMKVVFRIMLEMVHASL